MSHVLQELFTSDAIRKFLQRTRWVVAGALLVPFAWAMHPAWLPLGVILSLCGQLVQGWCFASLVKNRELSIRGPYLLVRNPMYLGRYFLILGFVVLLANAWAILLYTVLYYPYMRYRVEREERRLLRYYGANFEAYCSRVRRFWPAWGRLADPAVRFWDGAMFRENNGHWNILLTIGAYLAAWALHVLAFD